MNRRILVGVVKSAIQHTSSDLCTSATWKADHHQSMILLNNPIQTNLILLEHQQVEDQKQDEGEETRSD